MPFVEKDDEIYAITRGFGQRKRRKYRGFRADESNLRRLIVVNLRNEERRGSRLGAVRRMASAAALCAMMLGFLGCTMASPENQKAPEVAPRLQAPVALEVGASETFTFNADGVWYPAPYMIHRGQRMRVEYAGEKLPCPAGAVRYRIGQMEQILVADPTNFLITRPGAMSFYFDPARGAGFAGQIEVTITRLS